MVIELVHKLCYLDSIKNELNYILTVQKISCILYIIYLFYLIKIRF
jgi:hypothetical protein